MKLKLITAITLLTISLLVFSQTEAPVNQTDARGRKQGHWIMRYPDHTVLYDGFFKDDHPVGEFRRFYEDGSIKSMLKFSNDGHEAFATLYYSNGNVASRGKYVNQKKEGKWQFYSESFKDYLISDDTYSNDMLNGVSKRFYPDSTVAEKVNYVNGIKQGEWTKYYPEGSLLLRSNYLNGMIDGKFETWFENGRVQFSGQYKNDSRDGPWIIYNEDGTVKYRIEYTYGTTRDRQMDIDESAALDKMLKNKDNISDPEKTGMPK
jgi:antitoxin component YwqK of YwqJK toxin-antitoxin module